MKRISLLISALFLISACKQTEPTYTYSEKIYQSFQVTTSNGSTYTIRDDGDRFASWKVMGVEDKNRKALVLITPDGNQIPFEVNVGSSLDFNNGHVSNVTRSASETGQGVALSIRQTGLIGLEAKQEVVSCESKTTAEVCSKPAQYGNGTQTCSRYETGCSCQNIEIKIPGTKVETVYKKTGSETYLFEIRSAKGKLLMSFRTSYSPTERHSSYKPSCN